MHHSLQIYEPNFNINVFVNIMCCYCQLEFILVMYKNTKARLFLDPSTHFSNNCIKSRAYRMWHINQFGAVVLQLVRTTTLNWVSFALA
jgi:hypothetical protein